MGEGNAVLKGRPVAPQVWEELITRLRKQFARRLFDVRVRNGGNILRQYQPDGELDVASSGDVRQYNIGCVQTLLEAIAIAILEKEGIIDLCAPVGYYLPELNWPEDHGPGQRIKVRDLLSHSTGYHAPAQIAAGPEGAAWSSIAEYLVRAKPSFPPGTVCSWNTLGGYCYGEIIERLTGSSIRTLVASLLHGHGVSTAVVCHDHRESIYVEIGLEDLSLVIDNTLGPNGSANDLLGRLSAYSIPVVRRPISNRSIYPIAYSCGFAQYPDKLWGQNGVGAGYSLGVRFDSNMKFLAALALGAGPSARDIALQLLATTAGFLSSSGRVGTVGTIISCDIAHLNGDYRADGEERIRVIAEGQSIRCVVFRGTEQVTTIDLGVDEGCILKAAARWSAINLEFFEHPEGDAVCLTLGQVTYVKRH